MIHEQPTVGWAASERFPEAKVIQESAARSPGSQDILQVERANQEARQAVLEPMAAYSRPGTATQGGRIPPSPAEAARTAGTDPLYRQSARDRVEIDPVLEGALRAPEAENAFRLGRDRFLQQQQTEFLEGRIPAARAIPADLENGQLANYSVAELHFIKQELDGEISRLAAGGEHSAAHRLRMVRRNLADAMESQSPGYGHATSEYRRLSEPVNQGQVAQEIQDSLRGPAGQEQLNNFLRRIEDAPRLIKNGLGSPRFGQLEQVMTDPQMARIDALRRSVQREASYEQLRAPGSVIGKQETPAAKVEAVLPPVFNEKVTILRRGLKWLGIRSEKNMARVMNEMATDPNRLADILERLPPGERNRFMNAWRDFGRSGQTTQYATNPTFNLIDKED